MTQHKLNISTNLQVYLGRSKVPTNDSKPTSDPDHVQRLQQVFPPPNETYDSPLQMGDDRSEHWSSEIEIRDLWNTQEAFERVLKLHSIMVLTKYIRSISLLCSPDINVWRMKDLFQRIFLSTDPDMYWHLPKFQEEHVRHLSKSQEVGFDKRWCISLPIVS